MCYNNVIFNTFQRGDSEEMTDKTLDESGDETDDEEYDDEVGRL